MSTLHKVKAYFGMAPMDDYDDEYYEDDDRAPSRGYSRRRARTASTTTAITAGRGYEGRDYDEPPAGYRGGYRDEDRFDRGCAARGTSTGRTAVQRPARLDPRRAGDGSAPDGELFDEGSPLSKITTLRPKDYSEARTIGERFRDGTPVIMDLVSMDNADAKRLVDFAAGLAFALRGSFDKVATKVFLLSPADVDVTRRGAQAHRRGRLLRLSVAADRP